MLGIRCSLIGLIAIQIVMTLHFEYGQRVLEYFIPNRDEALATYAFSTVALVNVLSVVFWVLLFLLVISIVVWQMRRPVGQS